MLSTRASHLYETDGQAKVLYVSPGFWLTVFLCATTNFACRVVYRAARCVYSCGGGDGGYRAMQMREGSACRGAGSGGRVVDENEAGGEDVSRDAKIDVRSFSSETAKT